MNHGGIADNAADMILKYLRDVLGDLVFDSLVYRIETEYLGEMKIKTAILRRPELFERTFLDVLGGEAGVRILIDTCNNVGKRLDIDASYSSRGDFAQFMNTILSSERS